MSTGLENLNVYCLSAELEIKVYNLTKQFPSDERYRSVDQLRRSSASVSNNIAESYHRRSLKEKVRILVDIAKAEAEETKRNLEVCHKKELHKDSGIIDEYTILIKMIGGYVRFLRKHFGETKELMN